MSEGVVYINDGGMGMRMRTEREMYDLILETAKEDERVRAVYMNGSRTNPNVAKDKYRDFDIVYVVRETESFLADRNWISVFGKTAIVQEPDRNDMGWGIELDLLPSYTWLMLFEDGNRIDLCIKTPACAVENYLSDTLCIKLLDKDGLLPQIPEPNDSLYHVKKPSEAQYESCCNEFFWCLNNVAKGIVRDQLPYAWRMYHQVVHAELEKMVEWYIAAEYDFSVSTGMWGKYFKKYLSIDLYEKYCTTYSDADHANLWQAVFNGCDLFRSLAVKVGAHLGYLYNEKDDEGTMRYLEMMKKDAFAE